MRRPFDRFCWAFRPAKTGTEGGDDGHFVGFFIPHHGQLHVWTIDQMPSDRPIQTHLERLSSSQVFAMSVTTLILARESRPSDKQLDLPGLTRTDGPPTSRT